MDMHLGFCIELVDMRASRVREMDPRRATKNTDVFARVSDRALVVSLDAGFSFTGFPRQAVQYIGRKLQAAAVAVLRRARVDHHAPGHLQHNSDVALGDMIQALRVRW